jgi:cysteine synthase A
MSQFANILETIGNTPVVRINRLAPDGVNLFVKTESFNPMGSVKDRMALSIIEQAERDGVLKPGDTVIEATSGNTGIGLAMVCAVKGYPLVLTMAESFSLERRKILRFLGAKVVLTPADQKGSGMLAKAVELAATHGWFLCRQFENEANADAHTRTTAVEIIADFADQPIDFFVTGYGTGGTLKGTSRALKAALPDVKVIVCEPDNSQLLGSGISQDRNADGSPAQSHPNFRPHLMQGWTPDFIPKLAEDSVLMEVIDQVIPIDGNEALGLTRELAQKEGIFTGVSGGATFAGALEVCKQAPPGSTVLCMLPDTGERYLSTPLFEDIPVEMSEEEMVISQSTPGCRFDVNAAAAPAPAPAEEEKPALLPESVAFVEETTTDSERPVIIFALEWCEFCWSVKKLFKKLGIPYHSVDLDSVAFQEGNRGGEIRKVLNAQLGTNNIPQIYIGGIHIGGATDTFDAYNNGTLNRLLTENGVAMEDPGEFDAYSMLPGWLHTR